MTEHFSLSELTASSTAKARGIDNSPSDEVLANLKDLAEKILEPVRLRAGAPIIVTSGYRSPDLNKAVGGAKSSQHLTGAAADIKLKPEKGESQRSANIRLFNLIHSMIKLEEIKVGQLIDEYSYSWVHVSLPGSKVNQILHLK